MTEAFLFILTQYFSNSKVVIIFLKLRMILKVNEPLFYIKIKMRGNQEIKGKISISDYIRI